MHVELRMFLCDFRVEFSIQFSKVVARVDFFSTNFHFDYQSSDLVPGFVIAYPAPTDPVILPDPKIQTDD
jgi:hypothetical protein